jgi:uncharacterized protein (DUF433 family)
MTRAELLARASSRELTEWMLYYQVEPFGGDVAFMGHAITSSVVANANRRKGKKAFSPEDFMPKFGRVKEQGIEQAIQFAAMMTAGLGGQDKRK